VRALIPGADTGRCTLFGFSHAASPHDAALANGAFAHALELDDDHRIAVLHPGAVVVPAAFAAAESEGAPGRAFGFATTFYPTVAAYALAAVLLVSR